MQHRRRKLPVVLLLLAVVVGGAGFLMLAHIPAPTAPVEEQLPADRFIKKEP